MPVEQAGAAMPGPTLCWLTVVLLTAGALRGRGQPRRRVQPEHALDPYVLERLDQAEGVAAPLHTATQPSHAQRVTAWRDELLEISNKTVGLCVMEADVQYEGVLQYLAPDQRAWFRFLSMAYQEQEWQSVRMQFFKIRAVAAWRSSVRVRCAGRPSFDELEPRQWCPPVLTSWSHASRI